MPETYSMLIGGQWRASSSGEALDSYNPFDQTVWATIPKASAGDAAAAIDAARSAFGNGWKRSTGKTRERLLHALADQVEAKADHLARIDTIDNGKVIRETRAQMHFAARNYRYFAGYADKLQGNTIPLDDGELFDYTIVEPLGVAVLITAWNSPVPLLANKLAPALATGNTVVIKPSEHASASTLEFCKLIEAAGFPPGVINVVTGDGTVGRDLTSSAAIDKISFTGGLGTARQILKSAAETLVPVTTELGGKSPNIIFADADLDAAVTGAVAGIFGASGQSCIAGSRVLVEEPVYHEIVRKIVDRVRLIRLGDPLDPATQMGPVANRSQFDKILAMIEQAQRDGARLAIGGAPARGEELDRGFFIQPTVFTEVDNSLTICREEVFGPVLCILPFKDEDDAVSIANDSAFGLASGVWTNNLKRAHRMARRIEAGVVWVNTYRASSVGAPFGGTKLSGHGRERSWHALLEYTQVKNVMLDLSDEERDPFAMKL